MPGLSPLEQATVIALGGGVETSAIPALRMHVVDVARATAAESIAAYSADARVESVDRDRVRAAEATPDDPAYADQWALPAIGWDQAYGVINPAGSATIAVLDTGVDSVGDVSLVGGYSALGGGTDDGNGHGTWMASIAAATVNNGTGIAGVGYDGVSVMPVKVLAADGTGQDSDIIAGVVWAADHGADVILMAFSNPGYSQALQDAIDYAWSRGAVSVAAVGNDGSATPTYPAGDTKVVGVAATSSDDSLWSGSNFGAAAFISAPGVGISADALSGTTSVTGTSASAAIVAGAAALLKANDPGVSSGTVIGRLARNTDAGGAGNGRLNLARSLTDVATDEVVPAGAPGGGPVVGPYVAATTATVSGFVTNSVGGAAISGATVTISCPTSPSTVTCSTETTTTSATGFYSLAPNWGGSASRSGTVSVSATGFTSQSKPWGPLPGGGTQTVNFSLTGTAATLTVIKHVINDNSGTATANQWTMNVTGSSPSPASFAGAESPGTTVTLSPGAYSVSESGGPSGYSASSSTGCSGTAVAGGSYTCTVTNNDQAATLTVIKTVTNDNGGTAVAAAFTLDSGGANDTPDNFAGSTTGTTVTLDAGAYSVTETGPAGYTRSDSAGCSGTAAPGGSYTCTITNNDQAATLVVIKHVINDNGGTAVAANFTLDSGGANDSPDNFAGVESPGTTVTLDAGAYTVTESGPSGYSASFSANCSGTIANGETKTCTITNNDQAATLTVIKHVINDNGGSAVAADFTLDSGGANDSPDNFAGAESPGTTVTLDAGAYSVTETGPAGYTRSDSAGCSGTAAPGGTYTCTITNNDQAATLTVIKHVINDNGGTAVAANFTLDSGGANDSPDNFAGAESPGTTVTLDAGAYSVTETGPGGYTRSDSIDCSGTIANGETKTCTITNNDQAATLTVIKHVVNDNGGEVVASDFTLDSGGVNDSPDNFPGSETGTTVTLDAGSYDVTEIGPSGYSESSSAECSGTAVVGGSYTCTITNDDQAATLTVIKHVINDNGGSAVAADFTLDSGGTADSPDDFAGAESPGTDVTLDAGSYSVTETGPSGYTATFSAGCSGAIANGQTKTCTITNDDQPGTLTVIKHVINDNGGSAVAADFTLDSGGTADSPDDFAGAESPGTDVTLDAGSYSVTETGPSGYTATFSAGCSGTIANGQTKTCTVTNDDQPGKLVVIKHVINDNGGTATAANFTLDSGGTNDTPDNFAGAESPGTEVTLDAGSYNVTESGPSNYDASFSADCSGTIANGQTKTCTVTNDDQPAKLTVIKTVTNDNGGTATAANFTLDSGGTNDSPDNFTGSETGTTVTLDAGSYNVTETGPSGYTASFSAGCTGTAVSGGSYTCTVTNDDQPGTLTVIKHVINNNGGTKVAANFTLDSGGTNDSPDDFAGAESPGTNVTLDAGAYNVTETGPAGYTASFSADCSGTIANGEAKTCTVTNDDQPGTLTVIKHVINDNGGTAVACNFTLDSGGTNDSPDDFAGAEAPGTDVTLDAGAYTVTETGPSGYSVSYSAGCSGAIANGEAKTCTVTNDDQPGTLTVIKHVINDNGGTAVAGNFTLDSGGDNDSPDNFAGAESPGTNVTLDAGSYNVTESGPSGYTASYSVGCSGSIANGQTKTCTVTNDDQPGTLTVIKHVINNNGGTATAANFTLDSGGANDTPDNFAGAESPGTNVTLDAGSYNVTESGPSGYTASYSVGCSGSIANGQTKTCTVTNDDQPATLTVIKHVVNDNGGTATAANFTLDSGGTNDSPDDFAGAESPGTIVTLDAGSYSVTETGPSGYTASFTAGCAGTAAVGGSYSCTITNDDQVAHLIVIKHVINDNGGTKVAANFTLDSGGANDSPDDFTGAESPGTNVTLDAGNYAVTETGPLGYDVSYSAACSGSIAIGQTKTCTITNDDQPPATITLTPSDAVNNVGTNHTVTATVLNVSSLPVPGVVVRFSTIGSTTTSGSCTTNSSGQCNFTYTGPQLPGADIITAYADTDNDGIKDAGEPQEQATKAWILPATTPGQVTGGGQILNAAGNDKVAFGFNAKSADNKLSGNCTLVDPHPSTDVKIKCLDVTSLVQTGTHATFFGNATINGTATTYRIDVDDLREPGAGYDTFKIQTASGFILGGTLTNGNIQIHK